MNRQEIRASMDRIALVFRCDDSKKEAVTDLICRAHPNLNSAIWRSAVEHLMETHDRASFPAPRNFMTAIQWALSNAGYRDDARCSRCNGHKFIPAKIRYSNRQILEDGVTPCPQCNSQCHTGSSLLGAEAILVPYAPIYGDASGALQKKNVETANKLSPEQAHAVLRLAEIEGFSENRWDPPVIDALISRATLC